MLRGRATDTILPGKPTECDAS